jgi:hypothetical protein
VSRHVSVPSKSKSAIQDFAAMLVETVLVELFDKYYL